MTNRKQPDLELTELRQPPTVHEGKFKQLGWKKLTICL